VAIGQDLLLGARQQGLAGLVKRDTFGSTRPHRYEMNAYDGETIVPKYDETRPS
jgi:hypothetical protein